ncbi:helix-turn-helix domain-containing protein [Urechidicola croceus]|uniref:AraC family transcriptional regulator n=1 Tax=Urechidicola croceus TaxID=1850246 RepID=A0A1D8PAG7_9FLAO|nr:AraC family transcriptional regulator [Urechidicola croceus]AOW21511.1 AraC family transcriptional regulator [Urechidicola croceus]
MREIVINSENLKQILYQIQITFGGEVTENWGKYTYTIDNEIGKGSIKYIPFDWGINYLQYDITFFDDVSFIIDASAYNPIHFIYCLNGFMEHRFEHQTEPNRIEQLQSAIITNKEGCFNYFYYPKNSELEICSIQVLRKSFLKKRINNISSLNQKLYSVFLDTDYDNRFSYFGNYNLKIGEFFKKIKKVKEKGIIRILKIQGLVLQILATHITEHDIATNKRKLNTSLNKDELKIIRKYAQKITKNISKDFSLETLSTESGLSQAKLQEGFKLLYGRTVTEYIRHVRLESARDLIINSDLNISEIVYTIGFSSRSYFSKIFKEKYNISPNEYKNNVGVH